MHALCVRRADIPLSWVATVFTWCSEKAKIEDWTSFDETNSRVLNPLLMSGFREEFIFLYTFHLFGVGRVQGFHTSVHADFAEFTESVWFRVYILRGSDCVHPKGCTL